MPVHPDISFSIKMGFPLLLMFFASLLFGRDPLYLYMLTAAQIIYVPLMILTVIRQDQMDGILSKLVPAGVGIAIVSILFLHIFSVEQSAWAGMLAGLYLFYTCAAALYGILRFLKRGFVHLQEFCIDLGFIYLAIGGMWFFAHITEVDTGFSPMITWLTAIHFHYAAFLLPVFTGFLGRCIPSELFKIYRKAAGAILAAPILLALGITFSVWLELASVLLYLFGIYSLIGVSWKTGFASRMQHVLVLISFGALGITIVFSLCYALGNIWADLAVSIDFMLRFHGLLNSVLFALFGVVGWMLCSPPIRVQTRDFPISKVRGRSVIGDKILKEINRNNLNKDSLIKGLVDDMKIYEPDIDKSTLAPTISDFYENTLAYRLEAEIRWKRWFKPFAAIYRILSKRVQQINLPLHGKRIEMTGGIHAIDAAIDGRTKPRAWLRQINDEVVFTALYSWHRSVSRSVSNTIRRLDNRNVSPTAGRMDECTVSSMDQYTVNHMDQRTRTYMNIALPLPHSSMIGILELKQSGRSLQLSSVKSTEHSDAGIYLAWNRNRFLTALPIEETFSVEETQPGRLRAHHKMWIFSIPFLEIHYDISKKNP